MPIFYGARFIQNMLSQIYKVKSALHSVVIATLLIMPVQLMATIEDDVIEQTDNAHEIQALGLKPEGTWLPVPIPVSNPTIGSGLQAALLYLHPKENAESDAPNATSGIMGMYTNTETWLAGAFHDGNLRNDLYRYRIMVGTGEFNLDYFGVSSDSVLQDNPIAYSLATDLVFSQFLRRFPGSEDWYIGFRYMLIDSNVAFDEIFPGAPPISDDMTTSSLGLMTAYDSRDDNYYPTEGTNFEFVWMKDSDTWGSDFDFNKFDTQYNRYLGLSTKDVLALRLVYSRASEDTPFYLLPSLKMRGFPNGQYKSDNSLSAHIEWRHKYTPRWGFILFSEAGSAEASSNDLFKDDIITSYGAGVRWQVTKDKKLNLGVDVGYSDDDSAVYVQVGEKF